MVKVDVVVEASHFHAGGCAITLSSFKVQRSCLKSQRKQKQTCISPCLLGAGVLPYRPADLQSRSQIHSRGPECLKDVHPLHKGCKYRGGQSVNDNRREVVKMLSRARDALPTPALPGVTRRLYHFVFRFFSLRHDSDSNGVNVWERD